MDAASAVNLAFDANEGWWSSSETRKRRRARSSERCLRGQTKRDKCCGSSCLLGDCRKALQALSSVSGLKVGDVVRRREGTVGRMIIR
jgi:hypothetical protein